MAKINQGYFWDESSQTMKKLGGSASEGTGTTNYDALANKPSINGVELTGDKTAEDLGIKVPTKLPNPNSITFTGGTTGSYDGSSALEVHVPTTDEIINALPKWKWGAF